MLDLIRKRHEGDGWIVFTELANRPGFQVKRFADAFALGVWASTKYEGHLYEEKISREDLKKELRDPDKAQGVGKYAKYWWLVVSDVKITDGLVIPDVWGILTPEVRGGSKILKVVRKAPVLKPKPMDALFAMSMIRSGLKKFVSTADHNRVLEELNALKQGRVTKTSDEETLIDKNIKLERDLKRLQADIKSFEEASGVDLAGKNYRSGIIGHAVRLVLDMNEHGNAIEHLGQYVRKLSVVAQECESQARHAAEGAVRLRAALDLGGGEHSDRCERKKSWSGGHCTCGVSPVSETERVISDKMSEVLRTVPGDAVTETPPSDHPDPAAATSS